MRLPSLIHIFLSCRIAFKTFSPKIPRWAEMLPTGIDWTWTLRRRQFFASSLLSFTVRTCFFFHNLTRCFFMITHYKKWNDMLGNSFSLQNSRLQKQLKDRATHSSLRKVIVMVLIKESSKGAIKGSCISWYGLEVNFERLVSGLKHADKVFSSRDGRQKVNNMHVAGQICHRYVCSQI